MNVPPTLFNTDQSELKIQAPFCNWFFKIFDQIVGNLKCYEIEFLDLGKNTI